MFAVCYHSLIKMFTIFSEIWLRILKRFTSTYKEWYLPASQFLWKGFVSTERKNALVNDANVLETIFFAPTYK